MRTYKPIPRTVEAIRLGDRRYTWKQVAEMTGGEIMKDGRYYAGLRIPGRSPLDFPIVAYRGEWLIKTPHRHYPFTMLTDEEFNDRYMLDEIH